MLNIDIIKYEKEIYDLKSKIDKFRPFSSIQLNNLKSWFKIGFTAQSNAIEGNSFTNEEVKILVEDGITVGGKTLKEVKETQNLAELTDTIWEFFESDFILTEKFLLDLHIKLLSGIEKENLGKYRDIPVYISGSEDKLPSSKEVKKLMKEFVIFCNTETKNPLSKISKIHFDFVKINPFIDGNGRIARLLMNLYLIKYSFLPIIFPVVTRLEYIQSLGKNKTENDFYKYFLWQTYENMSDYLRFFED
ncbi:MAG: Fic family protein [Candidatus Gracilibacteria bacterium]|nr:Fic family protein [Candidatus Gracilibacteria bacterium]